MTGETSPMGNCNLKAVLSLLMPLWDDEIDLNNEPFFRDLGNKVI